MKLTRIDRLEHIEDILQKHMAMTEERMKEESYRLFCENAPRLVRVMPWSVELIEALEARGYMLSVASAADRIKVEANLACLGRGTRDFASVVTGADVERVKPAPDIFLRAAELCGVDPADALVCEDALSGVRAAKAAGMTAVAVTTSFSREALEDAGADYVFDDLRDMLTAL